MKDPKPIKSDRRFVYPVRFSKTEYQELLNRAKREHISVADVIRRSLLMKKVK